MGEVTGQRAQGQRAQSAELSGGRGSREGFGKGCVCVNKSENTGITSVDRSTKATLSTYNPWIQVSRLQKIYHFQHKKLRFTKNSL